MKAYVLTPDELAAEAAMLKMPEFRPQQSYPAGYMFLNKPMNIPGN